MLTDRQRNYARQPIRVMQIIWLGMLAGVSVFAVVLLTVLHPHQPGPDDMTVLTYAGVAGGVIAFVAANVLSRIMDAAQQQALVAAAPSDDAGELGDVPALCGGYQVRLIIACAVLEGAAFLNGIAYLSEGQMISMGVMGALLVAIALLFPGRGRVEGWLDRKAVAVQQERQWTRSP